MSEYTAEPKSRESLRKLAYDFRNYLGLENTLHFPIVKILDLLSELFGDFSYEILSDDDFSKGVHADIDIRLSHVRIRESVYENACKGNGRDRMTIRFAEMMRIHWNCLNMLFRMALLLK